MRKVLLINKKIFSCLAVLLAVFTLATVGHAQAVSINDCNKTANVAQCKQAFQACDKNKDPTLCKQEYLNTAAQLDATKAPPKSDCDKTAHPDACQNKYEACNTNNCKQQVIAQYTNVGADGVQGGTATFNTGDNQNKTINDVCGGTVDGSDESVGLSIKIGCKGKGNPIADATFAIIRILSDGVGLVIIASIIYGGIQYTGSRGDPQSTAMAVNRIRSSIFALLLFIFGYAILNYLIPAGFLG